MAFRLMVTLHFSARSDGSILALLLLQTCLTLCDPIDGSPPGSPVPGILQARTLEWGCHCLLQGMKVKSESEVAQSYLTLHIRLLATPWTAAYQAPPSIGFSRQEYWIGVPLPSPINHRSPFKIATPGKPKVTLKIGCAMKTMFI